MATPVKRSQYGWKLDGIEPKADLAWHMAGLRGYLAYWREAARIGLQVKDRSLARGLGVDGGPLAAISAYTRAHRRSAMTPDGKGRPSAPPLTPARRLSRTRSYLRAAPDATGVYFQWRFDHHTGMSWGQVLSYQAKRGRDVIGFSFDDWDEVVRRMDAWWKRNRVRWATFGAASRGIDPSRVAAHLATTKPSPKPAKPKVAGPATLILTLPPAIVSPPLRIAATRPTTADLLRDLTIAPSDARLVAASNSGGIFSGFRRGPGAATSGPFVRKPIKKRAN